MAGPGRDKFWEVLDEDARLALDRWCSTLPYKVEPLEWLDGGESGSRVAVIARLGPGFGDQVAIKFARIDGWNNWEAAIMDCPAIFHKQHLVDMSTTSHQFSHDESGWWITILKIAGGDLSLFRPLVKLSPNKGRVFGRVCGNIVKSVIADWNPLPLVHLPESLLRTDCLSGTFDSSRIVPGKPLWTWLETVNVAPHDALVIRPKWAEPLPNPIVVAANADRLDSDGQRGVQYGRAHGDLHLRNILVPTGKSRSRQYKLIDLDGYNSKSPLARDPMHLLLSIALEWLNSGINAGSTIAHSLINVIVRPYEETAEKEYQEVSQAIHGAGHEWASELGWGKQWTQQSLLFLVGWAMRYAGRNLSNVNDQSAIQEWFFEVAATAARAYLQDTGLWDRYRQEFATRNSGSSSNQLDSVPDISDYRTPDDTAEPEPDDAAGATVLDFRRHGKWQDLVDILRGMTFDGSDWYKLASNTEPLLREIARKRPLVAADEEIEDHLRDLYETLTKVLRPGTSAARLRAACTHAELLRGWLLDLITEPRR